MTTRHGKRDANERKMVEAWRALGAVWIPQPQESGFDGVLIYNGKIHIVEVKDVSKTNGRYTLTANEKETYLAVESCNVDYEIITNIVDALALVGAE